mmetsp:Transcript_23780/g.76265  ORF Transcript_23780/g.76265 Transcript_23780/m.76265 type:complete len:215 (-) Transcript_23780:174-818(-)
MRVKRVSRTVVMRSVTCGDVLRFRSWTALTLEEPTVASGVRRRELLGNLLDSLAVRHCRHLDRSCVCGHDDRHVEVQLEGGAHLVHVVESSRRQVLDPLRVRVRLRGKFLHRVGDEEAEAHQHEHGDRDGDARREPPGQLCEVDQLVEGTQHRPRPSDRGRLLREELATAEVQRTLGEQVDHRLERVSQGQREHERNEDALENVESARDHGEAD